MDRSALHLEQVVRAICMEIVVDPVRSSDHTLSEGELLEELAFCLLSSRVPFEHASAAARRLSELSLLNGWSKDRVHEVERALLYPLRLSRGEARYRFPRTRARQLGAILKILREQAVRLVDLTNARQPGGTLRRRLVSMFKGIGPKQASMFLRNVGISPEMAILDRYVLDYMEAIGLCSRSSPPTSLSTYERLEGLFQEYASGLGWPADCVDRSVWIVMRSRRRGKRS